MGVLNPVWIITNKYGEPFHDTRIHVPMLFSTKKEAAEMAAELVCVNGYLPGAWKVNKAKIDIG